MDAKPYLVTDMGGVIYSFSSSFDPQEHNQAFDQAINILDPNGTQDELDVEFAAVSAWLHGLRYPGVLPIYSVPDAARNLATNAGKYKVIVCSTSLEKTSEMILRYVFELAGVDTSMINEFAILNMAKFGTKKDPDAWRNALLPYNDIQIVVEDGKVNLAAAIEGLSTRSHKTRGETVMMAF
jgi:hypothetical protein